MKKEVLFVLLLLTIPLASAQIYPLKCFDGLKDGDETGIDCGGSCQPCGFSVSNIVSENAALLYWFIGGMIVIFIFVLIAMFWSSRRKKQQEQPQQQQTFVGLEDYVNQMLNQGYTHEQVASWLTQHGYQEEVIKQTFAKIIDQERSNQSNV